jgi:hypothetical protein
MRSALGRAWKWSALGALAVAGVIASTAATARSSSTADTTTTGSTTTTTTSTTTTTAGTKPSNSSAPTIAGTAQEGSSLAANSGTWSGTQPISLAYQWQRCDSHGSSCADISDADHQTYALTSADVGNTVRVEVTASNSAGSTSAASAASSQIAAKPAAPPTTTTAPKPAPTGCPDVKKGVVVGVNQVNAPARLQIADFSSVPGRLTHSSDGFTLRVIVKDTCGQRVAGAIVYATAVPYNQFDVPDEKATDSSGTAVLTFHRESGYPASRRQQLLAMFLRARKPGEPVLSGISSRRLIALPVEH